MKINKKYWLMPVIMILTILFLSNCYANCYADAECEHKNRFFLTRDNRNHFFRCSDCKYDWAESHNIGEGIDYTWDFDNQTCTANGRCTVCNYVVSETADATATVVQEKSCTLPELTTYSVTFGNSAFGIQTKENVQTAEATGHDLEAVEKKEASCTEDGYEAYWKCQTCKKLFSDEAGTVEISNPTAIKATGHNLKKVEKKDATATEEGNSTYWFCDKCNKYFSDAKAETEIKKEDTVLAKLSTVNKKETEASSAKTANATKVTSTTDKTTKSSPKTGDSTDVQLYVILMLVSIGAAAGAGAKRKLKTRR